MSACIESLMIDRLPVRFEYWRRGPDVMTFGEHDAWCADPRNRVTFGEGDWVLWDGDIARIVEIRPSASYGDMTLELVDRRFGGSYRIDVYGHRLIEHQHPVQVFEDGTVVPL